MTVQPTSAGWALHVPGEWRRFATFLRRPTLPSRAALSWRETAREVPVLLSLDMLLMLLVLGGIGAASALGMHMPHHMLDGMKLTPWLIAAMVVLAPLGEEAVFRGWLSGRPGHIGAVIAVMAGVAALMLAPTYILKLAGLAAGVLLAGAALYAGRGRPALAWFQRHFGWFYYASALVFAGLHLTNFAAAGASPTMLPLVLPQFLLALILGYLRVRRGLASGVALHMLHNALFTGLIVAGSG